MVPVGVMLVLPSTAPTIQTVRSIPVKQLCTEPVHLYSAIHAFDLWADWVRSFLAFTFSERTQ